MSLILLASIELASEWMWWYTGLIMIIWDTSWREFFCLCVCVCVCHVPLAPIEWRMRASWVSAHKRRKKLVACSWCVDLAAADADASWADEIMWCELDDDDWARLLLLLASDDKWCWCWCWTAAAAACRCCCWRCWLSCWPSDAEFANAAAPPTTKPLGSSMAVRVPAELVCWIVVADDELVTFIRFSAETDLNVFSTLTWHLKRPAVFLFTFLSKTSRSLERLKSTVMPATPKLIFRSSFGELSVNL